MAVAINLVDLVEPVADSVEPIAPNPAKVPVAPVDLVDSGSGPMEDRFIVEDSATKSELNAPGCVLIEVIFLLCCLVTLRFVVMLSLLVVFIPEVKA